MYIFYNATCDWEKDYILKELFPFGKVILINSVQMININFYKKLLQNNEDNIKNNCIFVLGGLIFGNINDKKDPCATFVTSKYNNKDYLHRFRYFEFKNILELLKPIVLFVLSDEYGQISYLDNLGYKTKLLVRNYYHHNYYNLKYYPKPNNIIWHPLGYNSNFLKHNSWIKNCIDSRNQGVYDAYKKKYIWSFIGNYTKNENRKNMIQKFKNLNPNFYSNNVNKDEMFNIYSQSLVVLNTRGWDSLDCLRLYETVVAGAIPLLFVNKKEACNTFLKEENPPWIFCDNLEEAYNICTYLSNNLHIAQIKINENKKWWIKRITTVRKQILDVVYNNMYY